MRIVHQACEVIHFHSHHLQHLYTPKCSPIPILHSRSGFVVLEIMDVVPGVYNVTPSTFYPNTEAPYFLNFFSSAPVKVSKLKQRRPVKSSQFWPFYMTSYVYFLRRNRLILPVFQKKKKKKKKGKRKVFIEEERFHYKII